MDGACQPWNVFIEFNGILTKLIQLLIKIFRIIFRRINTFELSLAYISFFSQTASLWNILNIILFYDQIFGISISYYEFAIIFYIMNIDQKDAEVQQYFTNMKKQTDIEDKLSTAQILAKMYEKDEQEYSVGILKRIYKFISDSQDKEDKRVGLMALSEVGLKMQGSARAAFVNKFHSPVFKLFETNQDQILIQWMEKAYKVVLQLGGNQNDATVQSNFLSSISLLEGNTKDIRKMGAYSALMAIVEQSPYLAFKKLLQKHKEQGKDNLQVLINASKTKNIKVRQYYIKFLKQYISYIGEKKDNSFKATTLNRFLSHDIFKENTEQSVHLTIQTLSICLQYLKNVFTEQSFKQKIVYALQKINKNKSNSSITVGLVIQRSLIQLMPFLINKNSSKQVMNQILNFLRGITGQDEVISQTAINEIVNNIKEIFGENDQILKLIVDQINAKLKAMINGKYQNIDDNLVSSKIQTVLIFLKERGIVNRIFDKQKLDDITSNAMMLSINEKIIKLINQIAKKNFFGLGAFMEKKFIILISKTLTGTGQKMFHNKQYGQIKPFLDKLEKLPYLESDQNKIRAIQSLSLFKFREQYQNFVGRFVKDRVIKKYLQSNNSRVRCATAQAAFNLYTKKNTTIAENQMMQILYKLLRIGMTDEQEIVRIKVFTILKQKVSKYELFQNYFVKNEILSHIFQATQDRNQIIRYTSLKILTLLHGKKPSALLIPFLKKFTYNIIMHFSTNFKYNHEKQYLINSLSIITQNSPTIIQNHVEVLLESLLGHLSDRKNYEGLQLTFFSTFQVLIESHPLKTIPYLTKICKHIVQALNDKLNSKKRHQSLSLLLSMIKKCSYVVVPYLEVPGLIESLSYLLRSQISKESRIDLMRVIGGFGAIDRHKYYKIKTLMVDLNEDQKTQMLALKGYNFKFIQKRKRMIDNLKSHGISDELKKYFDDIVLLDSGYSDPKVIKNKNMFKHLVNKYSTSGTQNKNIQISSQAQRQSLDPYNFNIFIIINLFSILNDTFLSERSQLTYDVIFRIFQLLGKDLQKDLHIIIPLLVGSELQVMKLLICVVKDCDVTAYLDDIIYYTLNRCGDLDLLADCLQIITYRYRPLLRSNLDVIVSKLYTLIQQKYDNHKLQVKIVIVLRNLLNLIEPYLSELLTIFFDKFFATTSEVTNAFLDFLMTLAGCCYSLPQYFSKISYNFSQILRFCHKGHTQCKPCLRVKIGNCVVVFLITFGESFMIYLPQIHKAIVKCEESHELYIKAIHYMENCFYGNIRDQFGVEQLEKLVPQIKIPYLNRYEIPKYSRKIEGTQQLIHEFDSAGKKFNDSDWIQWLRKISILLLRRSPNILLRTCADLAEEYPGLALQFYNISFYFLWEILLDAQKKQLIDNIKNILTSDPKPYILIRKTILNLVQFMNRKRCPLQISNSLLAECAKQSSTHSKSLYYKELQFEENPEQSIEDLIQIYMSLGQPENASGMLRIAKNMQIQCKVQWFQKLGYFQEAYKIYSQAQKSAHKNQKQLYLAKKIKCLRYFNEESFFDQVEEYKQKNGFKSQLASLACQSYAELGQWDQVKKWEQHIPDNQPQSQKSVIKSLLLIRQGYFTEALQLISQYRSKIYNEISDFIVFSSSTSSFDRIIQIQKLFQLEEIIEVKNIQKQLDTFEEKNPDQQERYSDLKNQYARRVEEIKEVWSDRLLGCPKTELIWTKFAYGRGLLFSNMQYFSFFYQYCQICIQHGKLVKCEKILHEFKKEMEINKNKYLQRYQMIEVLDIRVNFAQGLIKSEQQINVIVKFLDNSEYLPPLKKSQILFQCASVMMNHSDIKSREKVIDLLEQSTRIYVSQKQLQILGNMHLNVFESNVENKNIHIRQALRAFMKLLKTSQADNQYHLQSCLKVLGILFRFSEMKQILEEFQMNHPEVPLQVWINVTPQMIAHLYETQNHVNLTKIIKQILIEIGLAHPESILYSLIFAARSKIPQRIKPAQEIINKIKLKFPAVTQEIWTISKQLSNAAIKLKQFWYDGIQSAWSIYNQSKSTSQVLTLLKDLKEEVMSRKNTNSEIAFHHEYAQQIQQGFQWLERFQTNGNTIFLSQAFQLFIGVYRKVKQSFENLKKVYLKNVAPSLVVSSQRYLSSIPGLYSVKGKNIKISSFYNQLTVLQSKQRPRKLKIFGEDQKQYHFLLKGREDVRLDQRVMQFLGLVNKLLQRQYETIKKDLNITRYEIIPLTVNAGLIGWVEGCDTLNELIKDYRTTNKLRVYLERENYDKICPQYAYLPVINKLQVFLTVLELGQGKDLLRIFWYNSQNSEQWVERRRNYTTSLATMSMVGYILGLGDRHPSNIMIKKRSGKVVHIDFGDCFEVAALREKFPQKVPFRLTRMLQNAMGAAGIHGLYHQTCEDVMKVLRGNKDSLLAVLETFVHDPILSWRIIVGKKNTAEQPTIQKPNNLDSNKKPAQMIGSIMQGLQQVIVEVHKQQKIRNEDELRTPSVKQKYTRTRESQKINEKAVHALVRIKQKFTGTEWGEKQLTIKEQVSKLIREAISHENICQSWPGWCPYW